MRGRDIEYHYQVALLKERSHSLTHELFSL